MGKLISRGVLDLLWDMSKSHSCDTGEAAHLIYGRLVAHHVSRALHEDQDDQEEIE